MIVWPFIFLSFFLFPSSISFSNGGLFTKCSPLFIFINSPCFIYLPMFQLSLNMAMSSRDQIINPIPTFWKRVFPNGKIQVKIMQSKSSTQLHFLGPSNLEDSWLFAIMEQPSHLLHSFTYRPVETVTHTTTAHRKLRAHNVASSLYFFSFFCVCGFF